MLQPCLPMEDCLIGNSLFKSETLAKRRDTVAVLVSKFVGFVLVGR